MAAARGATTVFYGTAWDDANLLEQARQSHLRLERRDGVKRHFEFDWQVVAAHNPEYARFVENERERLGADHPIFLSQYCLRTLPGAGRLLSPTQLTLLQGSHAALDAPLAGETYVAGLDVAGEAPDAASASRHDATVLTIARLVPAAPGDVVAAPAVEVVRHEAWTGAAHTALYASLVATLRAWRVQRVVVDATGIGEPLAAFLTNALGRSRVEALKLTAESKSRLGYGLLTAVNGGRLRLYAGSNSEAVECRRQLELCRAVYRPNQTLSFFVDARDGHDDYVISLALALEAAGDSAPRKARGRSGGARRLDPRGGVADMVAIRNLDIEPARVVALDVDLERRARRDALPEHTHYADTGCQVHHSCLTCPLVRCRYDEPGGARKLLADERDASIVVLQRQGASIDAIASQMRVSRRTVFRVLARERANSGRA